MAKRIKRILKAFNVLAKENEALRLKSNENFFLKQRITRLERLVQERETLLGQAHRALQEAQIENTNLRALVPRSHGGDAPSWGTIEKAVTATDGGRRLGENTLKRWVRGGNTWHHAG